MTKQRNPKRTKLINLLRDMDDEGFSWVALGMLSSAMLGGATTQIWPDGLGGFTDRATIEQARKEAAVYLNMPPEPER